MLPCQHIFSRASMLNLKVNKQHSEIHRAPCLHQAVADLYSRLLSTSGNLGSVLAAMAAENHLWNIQDFNLLCFQFNLTRASQKTCFQASVRQVQGKKRIPKFSHLLQFPPHWHFVLGGTLWPLPPTPPAYCTAYRHSLTLGSAVLPVDIPENT